MSYMERLVMLNLLPLVLDRELKDLVFYYKCLFGSSDINQSFKQFVYKTMFTSLVNTYEVESFCLWTLVVTCPCYRSKRLCIPHPLSCTFLFTFVVTVVTTNTRPRLFL